MINWSTVQALMDEACITSEKIKEIVIANGRVRFIIYSVDPVGSSPYIANGVPSTYYIDHVIVKDS